MFFQLSLSGAPQAHDAGLDALGLEPDAATTLTVAAADRGRRAPARILPLPTGRRRVGALQVSVATAAAPALSFTAPAADQR